MFENGRIDQVIDQQHIGAGDRLDRLECEEFRVAGTGADQVNLAGLVVDAACIVGVCMMDLPCSYLSRY